MRKFVIYGLLFASLLLIVAGGYGAMELVFDFESGDLQGWQVVEGGFGQLVTNRDVEHNVPHNPYTKQGQYFLSTLEGPEGEGADGQVGTVLSPVIRLEAPAISFLIGGGGGGVYLALLDFETDKEYARATGANSEPMSRKEWNLPEAVGRQVYFKLVDESVGSWGHITFDDCHLAGTVDEAATQQLVADFADRKRRALEQLEAGRTERLAELLSPQTQERGERTVFEAERLTAVSLPVGGIGTGTIESDGTGARPIWRIFNNVIETGIPNSFFAVRVKSNNGPTVVRALQTTAVGPFEPVQSIKLSAEYPFGWYEFVDEALPVKISMEVLNPLLPFKPRESGMPCAIYHLTVRNDSEEPVEVSFLATQQNAVGFTGASPVQPDGTCLEYGGNLNKVEHRGVATSLEMKSTLRPGTPGAGDMALVTMGMASGTATWTSLEELREDFATDGLLTGPPEAGPSPRKQTLNGALAQRVIVAPHENRTVPFVLAWYFPNVQHGTGSWGGYGNQYTEWWDNALSVANEVIARHLELTQLTLRYHDSLYASDLPYWLLDRISSQAVVLRSPTCFWTKEGYFGGWEGTGTGCGCCFGNCSHVWHYAQLHARLFPSIARQMREEAYYYQYENGYIPFRQPVMEMTAPIDGQCGEILETYREYLNSPDAVWLRKFWPDAKQAMDFVIAQWDADADGMTLGMQHNTLDADSSGQSSWLESLYMAALAASAKMADLNAEPETAERYRTILAKGVAAINEHLWNGEYYFQLPGEQVGRDYGQGCHIDQMLGQWWANQLGLGWIFPKDKVKQAMQSLFAANFRPSFVGVTQAPRKFVSDPDAGLQMICWPGGGRPAGESAMLYADEVMSGFEYSAAALMLQAGLVQEPLAILRAAWERYDGKLRTDVFDGFWHENGNPFCDDECGRFYARPMSIWSVLLALQGFDYDGPAGKLGFNPLWHPNKHTSFFTTAEGYGLFSQRVEGGQQKEELDFRFGKLRLLELDFGLATGVQCQTARVLLDGQPLRAGFKLEGRTAKLTLSEPLILQEGQTLTVEFF